MARFIIKPMSRSKRLVGIVWLRLYRDALRARSRLFSSLGAGAFASFGRGSVLQLPVRLSGEGRIAVGADVFVGAGSWLQALESPDAAPVMVEIGDGSSFAGGCVISAASSIRIGARVLMARNVYVSDHIHAYDDLTRAVQDQGVAKLGTVEIGNGAWLGQNVVVCPGVRIGRGAVVGANSVVTEDVPDYTLAVGAPARIVRSFVEAAESIC